MFPLTATATLMTDAVIEAGLLYYQSMAGMTSQQADSFGQIYHAENLLDQYLLIEMTLHTMWAENYLDLRRYTIFIEDDQQRKYEPARMEQQSVLTSHFPGIVPAPGQKKSSHADIIHHMKTVFLYFPRKDFYGNPTIGADTHALKLVIILEEGGTGRIEGTWIFPRPG
jgi:hypothetical protein